MRGLFFGNTYFNAFIRAVSGGIVRNRSGINEAFVAVQQKIFKFVSRQVSGCKDRSS